MEIRKILPDRVYSSYSRLTPAEEEENPFNNLTTEGQKAHKKFAIQIDGIDKLNECVRKTVSTNHQLNQLICCEPTETIKYWYDKLKEFVSTEERTDKREIRNKYRQAIKPPSNSLRLYNQLGIDNVEAKKKGLAITEKSSEWLDEELKQKRKLSLTVCFSYGMLENQRFM